MTVFTSTCECCDDITYHIPLDSDSVLYDPDHGFSLHLTDDEMTSLYFELKEYKTGMKNA